MKVVIAPDSFKESLPANEVAEAIKRGFKRVIPELNVYFYLLVMEVKEQ